MITFVINYKKKSSKNRKNNIFDVLILHMRGRYLVKILVCSKCKDYSVGEYSVSEVLLCLFKNKRISIPNQTPLETKISRELQQEFTEQNAVHASMVCGGATCAFLRLSSWFSFNTWQVFVWTRHMVLTLVLFLAQFLATLCVIMYEQNARKLKKIRI